ncbi:MAG TPA: hypothetical protein VNR36_13090 [Pseudolysinimonas sp.]|nr:hypothetical protein [Pseudolysinimonas sp.]
MIDWFIDTFLGVWGRAIVDFYAANALPINSVIVVYGAILLVWHRRLRPYRDAAVAQVGGILAGRTLPKHPGELHEQVAKRIDWSRVAEVGPGRLVAGRWRLWPSRATATTLPRLLPIAELCRDAAAR